MPTKELEHLLERRQKFGVVDEGLVERGTELSDTIHRHTEQIALDIEERMKRGIQVSSGQQTAQGDRSLAPRPLSTGQELMELVVKKHW
ncbi:MAG: hypothetical protein JW797_05420 [Bradymonadales bacterium]|nr:hypothetical protein [Bradymonadales bacterium]